MAVEEVILEQLFVNMRDVGRFGREFSGSLGLLRVGFSLFASGEGHADVDLVAQAKPRSLTSILVDQLRIDGLWGASDEASLARHRNQCKPLLKSSGDAAFVEKSFEDRLKRHVGSKSFPPGAHRDWEQSGRTGGWRVGEVLLQ